MLPFRADRRSHAWESAAIIGAPGLAAFIREQGLAPLWFELLRTSMEDPPFLQTLRADLGPDRFGGTAAYLMQKHTLDRVASMLGGSTVPYAIFKGAQIRERVYADPAVRPLSDIDVLVPEKRCIDAIRALTAAGMELRVSPGNLSHEVTLQDGAVSVDLHWSIFRPGRSRVELAAPLLERRCEQDGIWMLDDTASLLVMLVHPAFAKHVNGREARLVRLVDLDRMIRLRDPDWDWVLRVIDRASLRTAAWSTLYWLRTFLGTPLPDQVRARLRPGSIHRAYLCGWIDHNLPARLEGVPLLVQIAFTLALYDRFTDAVRAVAALGRARSTARGIERQILRAIAPT